jgi:hypothetical protein
MCHYLIDDAARMAAIASSGRRDDGSGGYGGGHSGGGGNGGIEPSPTIATELVQVRKELRDKNAKIAFLAEQFKYYPSPLCLSAACLS